MPTDIATIQAKLQILAGTVPAIDYRKIATDTLQEKYTRMEAWLNAHKADPRFPVAKVAFDKMNRELASRRSIWVDFVGFNWFG